MFASEIPQKHSCWIQDILGWLVATLEWPDLKKVPEHIINKTNDDDEIKNNRNSLKAMRRYRNTQNMLGHPPLESIWIFDHVNWTISETAMLDFHFPI